MLGKEEGWLMIYHIGEGIDRLVSMDIRYYGVLRKLYEAARQEAGLPLALQGALALLRRVKAGELILLSTGFPIPPSFRGETDGLIGTAILARALELGLGAKPVVVTEAENLPLVAAACEGTGLMAYGSVEEALAIPNGVAILPFSKEEEEAKRQAETLVEQLRPPAIVAIEKPGRNGRGSYHRSSGASITEVVAKVDYLFLAVKERGGLTVGIGDQGNELGMGSLKTVVAEVNRFGKICTCPCGGGIAADIPAEVAIVSGVSDWGALGIAANLANLTSRTELLPEAPMLTRALERAVQAGAIDAVSHAPVPKIDGIAEEYHIRLLEQLRDLVRYARFFREQAPDRYKHAEAHSAFQEWRLLLENVWEPR